MPNLLGEPGPTKARISRLAVIGALLLPLGFLVLIFSIPFNGEQSGFSPSSWPAALRILLIVLGAIAPIASTTLGYLSIAQIRKSSSAIYGMRLAVFLSLFYPIIVLNILLFVLGWSFLGRISASSLIPLAWLVIVLAIDYWIIRISWNKAIS